MHSTNSASIVVAVKIAAATFAVAVLLLQGCLALTALRVEQIGSTGNAFARGVRLGYSMDRFGKQQTTAACSFYAVAQ